MTQITLRRPITCEDKHYTTLEIDEPTVGAIEAYEEAKLAGKTETGALISMLAVDTGWPEEIIRKIRSRDLTQITQAIAPFTNATQEDGHTGDPSAQTSLLS